MITRTIMTPEHQLIKLSPKQTLEEGLKIISDNSFLSLPVVEDKKFLGVLHAKNILEDLFLKRANEEEVSAMLKDPLEKHMSVNKAIALDTDYIETVAEKFSVNNISFVPIVNKKDEFLGIVTQKAIFGLVVRVYGLKDAKVVIHADDFVGVLSNITRIIEKHGANITNIIQYNTDVMGITEISIRLKGEQLPLLVEKLKERRIKVHEFTPQVDRKSVV